VYHLVSSLEHVPGRIGNRARDDLIWINPALPFYASAQVEMLPALGRVLVPESSCHRGASLFVLNRLAGTHATQQHGL